MRKPTSSFRRPCCADQTAIAMVRLLPISTAVLRVPRVMSSSWLAAAKPAVARWR